MSRFRRALAAAVMTAAAASGGLLLTASAAPAYAAAPAAPAAAPHGSHTITVSAHLAAPAAGGAAPRTEFPCVTTPSPPTTSAATPNDATPNDATPGAATNDTGCLPPTIHCHLDVGAPFADNILGKITADAAATCSATVPQIKLTVALVQANGTVVASGTDPGLNTTRAYYPLVAACPPGTYLTDANALITFPPGYVLSGGSNPIHVTSQPVQVLPLDCVPPPPPGGGGPCAIPAPSPAGHPAGRQPDVITCR